MFCIPARLRPSSPPPPFSHTGRRRRLGVLKPETGDGTPGLPEKPAPVQPAYRRGNSLPCRAVVASTDRPDERMTGHWS